MAIEGNLAHVGLADICQLLAMGRKTGCLTVSNRPSYGNIYFAKGRVCYSSVANRPDRLGSLLTANGLITPEALEAAVGAQGTPPRRRLGQILVEAGELDEEDLDKYVTLQIEEAVYHLFAWTEGTFRFEPDEVPDETQVPVVSINTEGLLLEGARRVDEWGMISKKIASLDLIFSLEHVPEAGDSVELTASQQRVLPFLDGDRTVNDIVEVSGMVEFDVAKALFGLAQAGFIRQTGERRSEPPPPAESSEDDALGGAYYRSGMLDDAVRELVAQVEQHPGDDGVRFRLAVALLRLGRFQEALGHLDEVGPEAAGGVGFGKNRALALEQLGRHDEARQELASLLETHPNRTDLHLALAVVDLKRGDAAAALNRMRQVKKASGDAGAPAMLYAYAILAAAMDGDLRAAVKWGEEGLERYPDQSVLLVNLGAVQEQRGRADEAEGLYLKAVSAGDTVPQAHKNLGDLAFHRNDLAGARAHYERAVKIAPRLGDDVYGRLGQIAHREEDADWARMLWNRALKINPENEMARAGIEQLDGS